MRKILTLSIVFGFMALWINQAQTAPIAKGQIAFITNRQPILVKAVLPQFTDGILKNEMVWFPELPANLKPNAEGDFEFEVNDERFYYVQVYYFASQILADYNRLSQELELPLVKNIPIYLKKGQSGKCAMDANADIDRVNFYWSAEKPSSALDYSTIAHELGHVIHYVARGFQRSPNAIDMATKFLVDEGTANILGALHLGSPFISGLNLSINTTPNVDLFVRFPDKIISVLDTLNGLVKDSLVGDSCPEIIQAMKDQLQLAEKVPAIKKGFESPDGYWSSAAINQPLWHAAHRFGNALVQKVYLRTISEFSSYQYPGLAEAVVNTATKYDRRLAQYLMEEYKLRGLL